MALDQSKLVQGLLAICDGTSFPRSFEEAGKRWAHVYADYAQAAQSFVVQAPPNSLAAGERVLAGQLAIAFAASYIAPQTAYALAQGLTSFWLAPPVTFGTGLVTAVGGTQALAQALPGIWLANVQGRRDAQTCCKLIAAAIHAFTLTVVTTTPNPSPPPPAFVGPVS
jgi:hypothetical protein